MSRPPKQVEYIILKASDPSELTSLVNDYLSRGFKLAGFAVNNGLLYQAMVK